MNLHQILHYAWTFLCRNYSDGSEGFQGWYNEWLAASPRQCTHWCITSRAVFLWNIKSPRWHTPPPPPQPRFSPYHFWLFLKLKSPLKGKRLQTVNKLWKIRHGSWWQLGELCEVPRCLLWRGLRSYVPHCPMYNVSCTLYFLHKYPYFSYYIDEYFMERPLYFILRSVSYFLFFL